MKVKVIMLEFNDSNNTKNPLNYTLSCKKFMLKYKYEKFNGGEHGNKSR
jgi:hypothetical protein